MLVLAAAVAEFTGDSLSLARVLDHTLAVIYAGLGIFLRMIGKAALILRCR